MTQTLDTEIRQLAYDQTAGTGPGVVFLGGFKSTKDGDKALHLQDWATKHGRPFLRFDYSGHGASSGEFTDGTIGMWKDDAHTIITRLTRGRQILVGSSMGGWIALLLARQMPTRIAGLITIAAAPDFTVEKYPASLTADQRETLARDGQVALPSGKEDDPYIITQQLIDEAKDQLILNDPLELPFPTRFLHGTGDGSVQTNTAVKLLDHCDGPDMRLTLVKDADHGFSSPECLQMITDAIADVTAQIR